MTTVSSPNADIAHQARTAANRASSTSTTAKSSDQPADPFAALFDAAMLQQTDPSLAPAVPTAQLGKDLVAEPVVAEDASVVTEAPVDPATLLASLPWSLPTEPAAVAVPVAASTPDAGELTDDAAAGLTATTAVPVAVATAAPVVPTVIAAATPETAALANLVPDNQLASGVRRAGQTLGTTTLGVQARTDGTSASDAEPETGKAAVADSIDPTSLGASTALELAAAANAAAAATTRNQAIAASDTAIAPSAGLVGETSAASASAATAGTAAARHDIPTVPGAPVALHAQQLQTRVDDAVRWMSTQSIQTAEIKVTPDDLGPITVHLRMDGDIANVSFTSEHAQTRQALEASMGGLRTALGDSGLQLGQAQVGSEQQNQQAFAAFANSSGEDRRARQAAAAADRMQATVNALGERAPTPALSGTSLVDLYA